MSDGVWRPHGGIDPTTPAVARIYDVFLGGKDNFEVDREAAGKVLTVFPGAVALARANRAFAARAARWCARAGVDQFVDIGTGLPTQPSVFHAVGEINPRARIVGVDNDPVVLSHDRALLENYPTSKRIRIVASDVRDPAKVLNDVEGLVYYDRPVAVFLVALLHLLTDAEDPAGIVAEFTARLAPGSLLVITHVTSTGSDADVVKAIEEIYADADSPLAFRSEEEIGGLFGGLELVEPGLVDVQAWPNEDEAAASLPQRWRATQSDQGLLPVRVLAGVGRVPDVRRALDSALAAEARREAEAADPATIAGELAVITGGAR